MYQPRRMPAAAERCGRRSGPDWCERRRRAARPGRSAAAAAGGRLGRRGRRHRPPTRRRSGTGRTAGRRGGPRPRLPGSDAADPAGHRLGLGEVRAVAVEHRDELVARAAATVIAARTHFSRSLSTATSPSSGSSAIVWPALDLRAADRRVADRLGDDERLDRPAGLGHRADVGGARRWLGSSASSAAKPSAALRVGTTDTGRSVICGDLAGGEDDVRVVGQEQDLARLRRPRPPRAARRCSGWPTGRPGRPPRPRSRGRSPRGRRPAVTATTARAGASVPSVEAVAGVAGRAGGPWRPRRCSPRSARRCAGERRGLRLADVARLVVEVLDADPAQRRRASGRSR